ncbi:hypothetical protein Thimo_3708 (plasmid) [Thioflavicoccus mobilis 8321]|uniref:Uncharacterized protein n=1 Tax=Thioflavicoccus mobilis 8321 TaxID=765912 RepID=L0H2R9_9GAMM|nr:hypothetical protein Thimo_3708 [Thioflavicoccus mobilis 8321]
MQTACLYCGTTGFDQTRNEVLKISILADDGTVLPESLIGPIRRMSCPKAQSIQGIAPRGRGGNTNFRGATPTHRRDSLWAQLVTCNTLFDRHFLGTALDSTAAIRCAMHTDSEAFGAWSDWQGSGHCPTSSHSPRTAYPTSTPSQQCQLDRSHTPHFRDTETSHPLAPPRLYLRGAMALVSRSRFCPTNPTHSRPLVSADRPWKATHQAPPDHNDGLSSILPIYTLAHHIHTHSPSLNRPYPLPFSHQRICPFSTVVL